MYVCLSARGLRARPTRVTLNSGSESFVVSQTTFVAGKWGMGKETSTFTKHFRVLLAEILVTSALQGYVSATEHAQGKCDAQVWEE